MSNVSSLRGLIPVSHGMALEKGWYDGLARPSDRRVDEVFNNFWSEISEAWEEYRANRIDPWYADGDARVACPVSAFPDGRKPEGVIIEVADLIVRIADFMGAGGIQVEFPSAEITEIRKDIQSLILDLNKSVFWMLDAFERGDIELCSREASDMVELVCAYFGRRAFWDALNLKVRYNATRSKRHGGKLA